MADEDQDIRGKDSALLKEIRDRFEYAIEQWKNVRKEGDTDMEFLSGNSWSPDELNARDQEGRPALNFDELNQYPNQLINDVRQNKRAVKVDPTGSGQSDDEATLRAGIIRDIEYTSSAQAAYITGFESAAQRGMGFWAYRTKYADDATFDLHLEVRRIANQASVVIDPDFKEADASDMGYAYIVDSLDREEFKRRFKNAEIKDFTADDMAVCGNQWIDEKRVQIAEYYRVVKKSKKLLMFTDPTTQESKVSYDDALPPGFTYDVLKKSNLIQRERPVETRKVEKYLTNGIEILEKTDWPGSWIPIVVVFGKELWVKKGTGYERQLQSLIRLARDPQKLYNYYRTAEAEEAGMTPKVPYVGAKGQFDGNKGDWQNINKVPKAYVEYNAKTNDTGDTVLPPPTRQPFQPNFQAYEMAAESARRSVMSAVGNSPLPTNAQRQNDKSGVALERIESASARGSFHFIDNYTRALEHGGRIMDELLPIIFDQKRSVGTRKPDDTFELKTVNDDADPKTQLSTGRSKVTISTGPAYQSQREEAQQFAELLAKIPGVFPQIADLIVKLKDLGPIGQEIAERLTPPEYRTAPGQKPLPPEALSVIQSLQLQAKALDAHAQQLQAELDRLQQERDAKIIETDSKERIVALQENTKLTIAEFKANVDAAQLLMSNELQKINNMMQMVHDRMMSFEQNQFAKAAAANGQGAPQPGAPEPAAEVAA